MRKLLTNQIAENLLIGIILIFNSQQWVFKVVPPNNLYKPGTIRKVKRKGIHYKLDISDYQEWLIYFYCKADSSDYLLNHLGKSKIIFDIGANVGQTALNMMKTQESKGLTPFIYAFEPYPKTFYKLVSNIELNKTKQIHYFNLGLGSEKATLHMVQHSPTNSGGFRMSDNPKDSISVSVISLDEFIIEQKITSVDFIKIDVEGFETQVLTGAVKTIKKFRPIIVFEYSLENIQNQNGDISSTLNFLTELNYHIETKESITNKEAILKLRYQTDLICKPN